jgi:signal transduction histidine kinase
VAYRDQVMADRGAASMTRPPSGLWSGRLADVRLALVVGAIQVGGSYGASQHQHPARSLDALGYVLVATGPAALLFRRRYPVNVLAVVWTATMAYMAIGYADGPIWLSLIIAFATVVITGHRLAGQVALVAGFVASLWLGPLLGTRRSPTLVGSLGLGAWLLVLLSAAEVLRIRRERAVEAMRTQEEEARRRASDERLRIARELHDVLAHNISMINVQAGTALHLMDEQPDRARSALAAIKDASKEALVELRSVLGVLRQDDEQAPLAPAPTVSRIEDLVRSAEAAGVAVRVEMGGTPRTLPAGVELAAFRIVQEALTNVARHAGPASATVAVTYGDEDIVLQVDDDGRGPLANGSHEGNGLPGMRERAAALGGTLQAGPRPGGGFRVRAWLPVDTGT